MSPISKRRRRGGVRDPSLVRWTFLRAGLGLVIAAAAIRNPSTAYVSPIVGAILDLLIETRR